MTREEIIDMAREAWFESSNAWATSAWFRDRAEAFEIFAKKVEARAAAAEREACRAECQALADILREHRDVEGAELAESLAESIAARGAA